MIYKRISLCLAAQLFPPIFTGAGIRFLRYAPGLQARGIDMHVFSIAQDKSEWELESVPPIEDLGDLPIERVSIAGKRVYQREIAFVSSVIRHCQQAIPRSDIIHFLSSSPYFLTKSLSLRQLETPIVVSHTLLSNLSSMKGKRLLQRLLQILTYQIADCVITSTSFSYKSLRDLGIGKPIVVIPNGVDIHRFQPVQNPESKNMLRKQLQLDIDPDGKIVLFVGSLTKRKGIDILLSAWEIVAREHPKAYLVLVGPTPEEMGHYYTSHSQTAFQPSASSIKVPERLISVGRVENVEDYYRIADVFLFPSIREGMPNVFLEALSSGLATITTPFLGLSPELGQPGKEFILVERSAENLARASLTLIDDPYRCHEVGMRGRQWIERHLSLEKSLDLYSTLYRDLTESGHKV